MSTATIVAAFSILVMGVSWLLKDSGGDVGEVAFIAFVCSVPAVLASFCWLLLKANEYLFGW
jgi:hypothetical protein